MTKSDSPAAPRTSTTSVARLISSLTQERSPPPHREREKEDAGVTTNVILLLVWE